MAIDTKKFIAEVIGPHLDQSCHDTTNYDCEKAIGEELESFVCDVRKDTLETLVTIFRAHPTEGGKALLYNVADEIQAMVDYAVWAKEADKFLKDTVGAPSKRPVSEVDAIAAAHPLQTKRFDLHNKAMRLVGERHAKGDFVDLVNWLLFRLEEKKPI